MKACAGCGHMFYCNKVCQKEDWNFHKLECKLYNYYPGNVDNDYYKLLLRLYLTLERYPNKRTQAFKIPGTDPPQFRSYNDLRISPEMDNKALVLFEWAYLAFRLYGIDDVDRDKLFEHYCKMHVNSVTMNDINNNDIGLGFYLIESGYEHSCDPNACVIYKDSKQEIRAVKNISPGEKVTINYLGPLRPRDDRQKELKRRYYFTCSCTRCLDDDIDKGKACF